MKCGPSLAFFIAVGLVVGCALPMTGEVKRADECPVPNIGVARTAAVAEIAARGDADHLNQTGYRLDLSDEGAFWLAVDGPNPVGPIDLGGGNMKVVAQFGGSSFRFKIAKCSGAISDFEETAWR